MKYPIITSRAASKDLAKITALHSNLVQGLQQQSQRVAEYQAKQAANASSIADASMRNANEQKKLQLEQEKITYGH